MSLTGIPLIAAVACAVLVSAAVTVLAWRRAWRPRLLVRPLGILLTEALLLAGIGLVVNRSELFYPSWSDLLQPPDTPAAGNTTVPGALDAWLRSRAGGSGDTFAWHPPDWATWRLAAAPTVVVPADYLSRPDRRYSVVVVIGDGWAGPATGAEQTIVVHLRTTSATTAAMLTEDLPARLGHDLRVTERRWALVCPVTSTVLAGQAAAVSGRYPVIALVRDRSAVTPAGVGGPGGQVSVGVTVGTSDGLAAAVVWAAQQTPPPLAAAVPPVAWLPVHRRPHRHGTPAPARTSSGPALTLPAQALTLPAPTRTGGSLVPGQPRL